MKTHRAGWSTMIGFVVTLIVLLVGACTNSRSAWSFSADVPSPVLASITGGGEAGSTEEVPVSADTGKGGSGGNVVNPAASSPDETAAKPGAAAPTGDAGSSATSSERKTSRWPAIILGTVVVLGVILVVLYFLTRERDD